MIVVQNWPWDFGPGFVTEIDLKWSTGVDISQVDIPSMLNRKLTLSQAASRPIRLLICRITFRAVEVFSAFGKQFDIQPEEQVFDRVLLETELTEMIQCDSVVQDLLEARII